MLFSRSSLRSGCFTFILALSVGFSAAQAFAAGIPARPRDALTGSQFAQKLARMPHKQREGAILAEFARGNVPDFLRRPVPVKLSGGGHEIIIKVLPDYLAIGSDQDFVRVPMTPMTAQRIADAYGYMLPTQKMVDDIYRQASVKLAPKPLPPGPQQTSVAYFVKHEDVIHRQYAARGKLVAGHKKDIVLTNRLVRRPGQVAIYGWHRPNGKAIQPLSLVHISSYADYSHGVRLIAQTAEVDGKSVPLTSVLNDRRLANAASYEGRLLAMRQPRTPGASRNIMLASHAPAFKGKAAAMTKGKSKAAKSQRLAKLQRQSKNHKVLVKAPAGKAQKKKFAAPKDKGARGRRR